MSLAANLQKSKMYLNKEVKITAKNANVYICTLHSSSRFIQQKPLSFRFF
jgi:small nuclear ribonucleoprotein (snRNP)-like protein